MAVSPVTPKPALLNPKLAQAVPTPVSPPAAAAATPAAVSGAIRSVAKKLARNVRSQAARRPTDNQSAAASPAVLLLSMKRLISCAYSLSSGSSSPSPRSAGSNGLVTAPRVARCLSLSRHSP